MPRALSAFVTGVVTLLCVVVSTASAAETKGTSELLRENWFIQSSAEVHADGSAISKPGFGANNWYQATLPATVLSALVELHPHDEKWARYLVTAYDNKGDLDSAVAGFTRLMEVCPASAIMRQYHEYYRNKSRLGHVPHSVPDSRSMSGHCSPSPSPSRSPIAIATE